jgi:hypothetical protein
MAVSSKDHDRGMMYGVIRRYDLTDAEWESLSRYLPAAVTRRSPS